MVERKKLEEMLGKYLGGFASIKDAERPWLVQELASLYLELEKNPEIEYSELWDKIHGLDEEKL